MKNKFFTFILALFPVLVFANGGVTVYSWTKGSANPVFRTIKEVSIISEKLNIKIDKDRSIVHVQYLLRNNSDKDFFKADYAFPVDYFELEEQIYDGTGRTKVTRWDESYIENVSFKQNSKELEWLSSDTVVTLGQYYAGYYEGNNLYRRWFYTQIDLPKHAVTVLEVEYSIKNFASTEGFSPLYLWETDDYVGYRFSYDFSPAKHWHDGLVGYFSMKIDASSLDTEKDFLDSETLQYPFESLGNNIYTYEASNFDLNTAKPINLRYSKWPYNFAEILQRRYIPIDEYTLTTSSNISEHPVSNLNDLNLETAWVAKGGEGAWIDIVFSDTLKVVYEEQTDSWNVSAIILVNGYHKDEKTYEENSTVKRLALLINRDEENKEDESINESSTIYIDLERKPYQKIYLKDIFEYEKVDIHDFFDDPIDWRIGIKKIRLKILEVDKGSKYDDLCISEIIILK